MFSSVTRTVLVLAFLLHNFLTFGQNPDCPTPTFLKISGSESQAEYGTAITLSSDGNLYIAGRNVTRTFIQKVSLSGELIWMREFVLNNFEPITPTEIVEDTDGMIVGCGTQVQFAGATRGFVFRYDPNLNTFLWAHPISSNNPISGGILEKTPGGSFVYYQNSVFASGETEIEILDLDRATGNVIPAFASRYEHISYDAIQKMIVVNGSLFGVGSSESRDSFSNTNRRQLLARFDPVNGMPIWAQLSHVDSAAQGDYYGRDLLADGDSLVAAYIGDPDGPAGVPYQVYLQKTDLDGNIIWVKKYDFTYAVMKLLLVSDGYIIFSESYGGQQREIIKVDKNGEAIWGKALNFGPATTLNNQLLGPNHAVTVGDSIYLTGIATTGNLDVLLLKMYGDGSMQDTCANLWEYDYNVTKIQSPVRTPINLQQLISTAVFTNSNIPWTNGTLEEKLICPDCTVPDPCPEDNDFSLALGGIDCADGKIQLNFSYCDLNGDPISDGLNITFYNGNPFSSAAEKLYTFVHDSSSQGISDSCTSKLLVNLESLFGLDNLQNGGYIYAVINDPGTFSTPFSLTDFPISEIAECAYTNNLDSIQIQLPMAPTLALGPDQVICANETVTLNAGPGFYKYQWSNGNSTQSTTINFGGQYRVTVTDACGFRQIDTVTVQVKQLPLVFENGQFCPGKSVTIRGFTFNQEGTFQNTIPGINNDCDTSVTFNITRLPYEEQEEVVYICPFQTVTINGVTYEDSGLARDTFPSATACDTIVFYFINQLPLPFRFFNFKLCPGESVTFNGQVYSQATSFTDTLYSSGFGCDTIAYVDIQNSIQVALSDTIEFCPGTTVELGGQSYTQPGVFLVNLPSTTGDCDTLATYTLVWLPAPNLAETIQFCPGESVSIGGQTYTQPGTVLNTLPGAGGGCDTLITYTLEWLPAPTRAVTLEFCKGESIVLNGQTYTQPGVVTLSIPATGNGCDTLVTYTLQYVNPPASTLSITCPPNQNLAVTPGNGSLPVNYDLPSFTGDCICPGNALELSSGLASGASFPVGNTQVCYAVTDSCGNEANCCFTVSIGGELPCDTKTNGCIKYDLLGITADPKQNRTYRIRVTNTCTNKLIYTAIELPEGISAIEPSNLSTYTAPSGRNYSVRNPNYSPFYSIRFKSNTDSIANGQSDVFEYTLPAQANPTFINITTQLATQQFYAAHLNTFNCPIGITQSQNRNAEEQLRSRSNGLLLFPNPTDGALFADLSRWNGADLSIQILDSRGMRAQSISITGSSDIQAIPLAHELPSGLYFLEIVTGNGEREVGRFVLEK